MTSPVQRFIGNPILTAKAQNDWECTAVFNGCPIEAGRQVHLLYRAEGKEQEIDGKKITLSTIGVATSRDRVQFGKRRQLIVPEYDFEKYGCEDPRITKIDDKYFIFYTALSKYPPDASSIKVAVAVTRDLYKIDEKHLVTPFNAKAMALFPERINGSLVGILTVNTDVPPAKIAVAYFKDANQIWDDNYWYNWYRKLDHYILPSLRSGQDHVEVGAVPVKTSDGWLLIYCYIKNYFSADKLFSIEAALLDIDNPLKMVGRLDAPLLTPQKDYELVGQVPNVIFPSGAIVNNGELGIYYGAADTSCALATCKLDSLLKSLRHLEFIEVNPAAGSTLFKRYSDNPIVSPVVEHAWESKYTLNPAAVCEDGKVFIVYRAMGSDDTSVLGMAISNDGVHIEERLNEPVYSPRESFEVGLKNRFSGCEDPRLTKLDDRFYMCYTAYDGVNPTRVALTSIGVADFLDKRWSWEAPILISPPGKDDKNACILPEKIDGKFVILHRFTPSIWIDYTEDLNFQNDNWISGKILMEPRVDMWDSEKIGIGPPPVATSSGWILIYHGISRFDKKYRLGAALLDHSDPSRVLARLPYPILEPVEKYENSGLRPGTVFACGAVVLDDQLFIYYGGADQFVCVASLALSGLLNDLSRLS